MNDPETDKPLRTTSFVIHATRGLIRNQVARRKTMFVLLVVALVLLFSGSTFLAPLLNPGEYSGWALLFWFVCIWLTVTAMLLAVFDLLVVRAQARKAAKTLHKDLSAPDASGSTIDE